MLDKQIGHYVKTFNEFAAKQILCELIQQIDIGKPELAIDKLKWLKQNAEEYNKFFPEGW